MANHKSAEKRNRQNAKKKERNKVYRTMVKNATKYVLEEVANNNKEEAAKELKNAERVISRVASKGVLHRRAASRKISGLSKKVNQLSTTQ